jgi:hypothetical protein
VFGICVYDDDSDIHSIDTGVGVGLRYFTGRDVTTDLGRHCRNDLYYLLESQAIGRDSVALLRSAACGHQQMWDIFMSEKTRLDKHSTIDVHQISKLRKLQYQPHLINIKSWPP